MTLKQKVHTRRKMRTSRSRYGRGRVGKKQGRWEEERGVGKGDEMKDD